IGPAAVWLYGMLPPRRLDAARIIAGGLRTKCNPMGAIRADELQTVASVRARCAMALVCRIFRKIGGRIMTRLMMMYASLCSLVLAVAAIPVQAQPQNTVSYVADLGSDNNNCAAPSTPCQTFHRALSQTFDDGEIDCVNPALFYGLGSLTITKS